MSYVIHLVILFCIYAVLSVAFTIPFGWGRLFNLAHVSLFGLGAYTTALMLSEYNMPFWLCLIESIALSACVSLLIGAVSLRLADDSFAIGTLAFSALVTALLLNWKSLTHGALGIAGIPRPSLGGYEFQENESFMFLAGGITIVTVIVVSILNRSRLARQLRALAEHEIAARSLGVHRALVKNIGFTISSMFAAVAGALYATYLSYVEPSMFGLSEMVFVLGIVVVGKPGTVFGVVGATALMLLIPEALRFLEFPASILGPARQFLTALLLLTFVYMRRDSLTPRIREV